METEIVRWRLLSTNIQRARSAKISLRDGQSGGPLNPSSLRTIGTTILGMHPKTPGVNLNQPSSVRGVCRAKERRRGSCFTSASARQLPQTARAVRAPERPGCVRHFL